MRAVAACSGWGVAAVLAAFVVARISGLVAPGESVPTACDNAAWNTEEPKRETATSKAQEPEVPAVDDAEAPAFAEFPGDDWEPPGKIDGLEGIFVFLSQATPRERALAERILAASKAKDAKAVVDAAREAQSCPEAKVRAMAVKALCELFAKDFDKGEGSESRALFLDAAKSLLGFSEDESAYVSREACSGVVGAIKSKDALGSDAIVDLAVQVVRTADFSSGGGWKYANRSVRDALGESLGFGNMDLSTMDKAAEAFRKLAKSDDERVAENGYMAFCAIAEGRYGRLVMDGAIADRTRDVAKLDEMLAKRRAEKEEALAAFPDDGPRALRYANILSFMNGTLAEQAKERFGDNAEAAAAWIAEEKARCVMSIAENPAKNDEE